MELKGWVPDCRGMGHLRAVIPDAAKRRPASPGTVLLYACNECDRNDNHESVCRILIAKKLAILKGYAFGGEHVSGAVIPERCYFVPSQTLLIDQARALGIQSEDDLFGGVVPYGFVGSKAIVHPLIELGARAPFGWRADFACRIDDLVLAGYSAFAAEDARRAGVRLLERGPVRIKPVRETGGRNQVVISTVDELDRALANSDVDELWTSGVVIEEELVNVTTYSVAQVHAAGLLISYYGVQHVTCDNSGAKVYGGSELVVRRGDFESLLTLDMPAAARRSVLCAREFDARVRAAFPTFFASRCNYDVADGVDATGRSRCAVLEQSWRVGGASGAEVAALESFRADRGLATVRASCVETYAENANPPAGATVYFSGVDREVGPILKYTLVEPYGDA